MIQSPKPETPEQKSSKFRLILFVAGEEQNSRIAKENLSRICRDMLGGRCEVQLVDVLQDFDTALNYNILLTPSLLVIEPPPQILIVGNLNDMAEVRATLQVDNRKKLT